MDKIQKALAKLSEKEKQVVRFLFERISIGDYLGLDVQKLAGNKNIYRVRKGNLRIIYRRQDGEIKVLAIERRSEKTYRRF